MYKQIWYAEHYPFPMAGWLAAYPLQKSKPSLVLFNISFFLSPNFAA
jgi:hypothetical protein